MRMIVSPGMRCFAVVLAMLASVPAGATTVRFTTSVGSFDVNLYDRTTPVTVANFLSYLNSGAYTNVIIHRSVSGFVVQGGGYTYTGPGAFGNVTQNAAITNEPVYSNVRGTIAMAKVSGNANSATSQWFINMGNNSANLDVQNGGFAVFGEVVGTGMAVLDAVNALQVFSVSTTFDSIPLRNYTSTDAANGVVLSDLNLIVVTSVTVLDNSADTAASLSPVRNTLISQSSGSGSGSDSGGGGAIGVGSLLLLGALSLWRQRRKSAGQIFPDQCMP